MAFVVPSFALPVPNDEQRSSPDTTASILSSSSPVPSSPYDDEDSSTPHFILSSPLPPWDYLAQDDSVSLSPPVRSRLPPLASAAAMPALSPRLSYSASADSYLPSSHSSLAHHHSSPLDPSAFNLPPASSSSSSLRPSVLSIGGIHIPPPHAFAADVMVFPAAPLPRPSGTVELASDSGSDDDVQVVGANLKRRRTLQEDRQQRREQKRRLREQHSSSSASQLPQPAEQQVIDAEAEATADIVDLTSDNHPLLAPPTPPQPLPPPVTVPAEPPSPPVPKHQCPICLSASDELASLKCGHVFCADCVRTAVQLTHRCPTCRAKAGLRDIRRLYM